MFTDPIADMLTRLRNGLQARKAEVIMPYSKMKQNLANILAAEGYIAAVVVNEKSKFKELVLKLRYDGSGQGIILGLRRISKPGQRIYASVQNIPKTNGGLGLTILSTSKGLMTDRQARKEKYGGEVVCQVW